MLLAVAGFYLFRTGSPSVELDVIGAAPDFEAPACGSSVAPSTKKGWIRFAHTGFLLPSALTEGIEALPAEGR